MEGVNPIIPKIYYQVKNLLRLCQVQIFSNHDYPLKKIVSSWGNPIRFYNGVQLNKFTVKRFKPLVEHHREYLNHRNTAIESDWQVENRD